VADGPRVGGGQSVFRGALLEVRVVFSDAPQEQRRQSGRVPRTARPYCADNPPLPRETASCFASCDLLPLLFLLALFMLVSRSCRLVCV
jgi:hypothetical protein